MTGQGREVFFELTVIGRQAKVTAIDAASGIEVMVLGPSNAARSDLEKLALAKLKRRLERPDPP